MRKFHFFIIASGALLLALLVYSIGPRSLWHQFTMLGWALIPLVLLEGAANLFHAQGWRHCLSGPHRSLPFLKVFSLFMAGSSINYLTPTAGLGGEVTKGALLASDQAGADAAAGVILDKLSYALAQLIFVIGGALGLLYDVKMPFGLWLGLVIGTVLLGCGIIGFLLLQQHGKLGTVVRWSVRHHLGGAGLQRTAQHMTAIDRALQCFYRNRPFELVLSMFWHTLGVLWSIIPAYYFFVLLTDHASLGTAAAIVLLGTWFDLVTFALPADIGVQEAGRVVAFRLLAFPLALGLTYGIARRVQQLFWAATGLTIYAVLLLKKRHKKASPAADERNIMAKQRCS